MISLLSIQDIRGHGLPGTPVSRLRERLRRGALVAETTGDSALGRDLDRLAARLERVRARGGDCAEIRFAPELEHLLRERARRGVGAARTERKRA